MKNHLNGSHVKDPSHVSENERNDRYSTYRLYMERNDEANLSKRADDVIYQYTTRLKGKI